MKKKIVSGVCMLLTFCILLAMVGCATADKGENKYGEMQYYGNSEDKDALRICLDIGGTTNGAESLDNKKISDEISQQLKDKFGIEDVSFEFLPKASAEREAIVERMKVEIMSGNGPDVMVVRPSGARIVEDMEGNHNPLFPYPEKAMESGLFLPLDEYMENKTTLTDWSKQQSVVMEAGKNEEGQQIIPLTYSFPVMSYAQNELSVDKPETVLSWNDVIDDPEMMPMFGELVDCKEAMDSSYGDYVGSYAYLDFILGRLADFSSEELAFTEDELLQRVNEILSLQDYRSDIGINCTEGYIGVQVNKDYPMTYLPLYSDDGGVTVSIDSFAVVNRNTQMPDEAFAVIDLLMSDYMQQKSCLYSSALYFFFGLPMNNDLYQQSAPIGGGSLYFIDENYSEVCDIRAQITHANYHDDLSMDLHSLLMDCRACEALGKTVEEIVHEYYDAMQRRVRE